MKGTVAQPDRIGLAIRSAPVPHRTKLMRTDLDHLPAAKQRDLERVVQIIFEEFEDALAISTSEWKKRGRIEKIILYGSYARGGWVDEPHTAKGYKSDFDLLIIVNHPKLTDRVEFWSSAEERLNRELSVTGNLKTPVNFIVHSLKDVNKQLEQGRPFFIDIVEQGIALYEAEGFPFASPQKLPPAKAQAEAEKHFDRWFPSAETFLQNALDDVERKRPAEAAFLFHQATERLYHCVLLVLTLYSPKSHKLNFLRSHCEEIAPSLIAAWPRDDKFSRRCFELLRLAYVNARYSEHYKISEEELNWIGERVAELQALVKTVCEERLVPPGQ